MAAYTLTIRTEIKPWFRPAFVALAWACAASSLISDRIADAVSRGGVHVLARYGVRYIVE